ncbi:MAG: 50S ribosomal protein L32e [Thaumarchaeota archaeon]|nr:50S ribosomal protein L32e [Nitrososphaerota archaeon]
MPQLAPVIAVKKIPAQPQKKFRSPKKEPTPKPVDLSKLLTLRKQLNQNRPKFVRPESWRYVRLHEPWRKPKGIDHKVRKSVKGWPQLVSIGYRNPRKVRGLHPSGLRDVLVHNTKDFENLNPKADAVRFASTLGGRSRAMLMEKAHQMGLRVLNPGKVKQVTS